jgi:membrane-bound lytic murein transglycosylase D
MGISTVIKLILLAACGLLSIVSLSTANAEEMFIMSTQLSEQETPESLTSARNIKLELIPDSELVKTDLWARIRNGYGMHELDSALIAKHEQWYASRPDYMARMTDRGRRYLYYITAEVERRGMPTEIALLPMIESAFNPGAYSTSAASGIWQFIPSTGKHFGMPQNWWYDGRRDVISATNGALTYLQKLHNQFGDWELALAAYNCGEGAIARAQQRNRVKGLPTNYSSLDIPTETRNYVPKLLAIKNIISAPENFGLTLPAINNAPYFSAISMSDKIDVKMFAELADISVAEFVALNPAHNRPVILHEDKSLILLPVDHVDTFLANFENNKKPLLSWQSYQSKNGERLDELAPKLGLSIETLRSVNSLSAHTDHARGQTLLVPLNEAMPETELTAFDVHLAPPLREVLQPVRPTENDTDEDDSDVKKTATHKVRRGETLGSIAQQYHVNVSSLRSWNHQSKTIKVGQVLQLQSKHRVTLARLKTQQAHQHLAKHARSHSRVAHLASKSRHASKSLHRKLALN